MLLHYVSQLSMLHTKQYVLEKDHPINIYKMPTQSRAPYKGQCVGENASRELTFRQSENRGTNIRNPGLRLGKPTNPCFNSICRYT